LPTGDNLTIVEREPIPGKCNAYWPRSIRTSSTLKSEWDFLPQKLISSRDVISKLEINLSACVLTSLSGRKQVQLTGPVQRLQESLDFSQLRLNY